MEIIYFLTYGYSLKTWSDSGQLAREMRHFQALKSENEKIKFKIFSYGEDNDFEYIEKDFIEVVSVYKYIKKSNYKIVNFIKSFFIKKILREVDLDKSELVIQNQLLGSWVSYLFKKNLNIPLIIRTGYDMFEFSINENKNISKKLFFKYLTKKSLDKCDLYTVTSLCDKDFLLKNFSNMYSSKIKIRSNWVDSKENIQINNKNILNNIVSVGRIEEQKNYELIIRSLQGTNFELDIFGEGSLKEDLVNLAKELNVNINFLGIVNNEILVQKLQHYKFYISSSKFEGNPKSVLEAMSAGCIVIASKIKNHLEFLNIDNSILFDQNIKSLKETIMNLDKISQRREDDLISNSLETIKNRYNLNDLVKKEIKDINNLVK
jgi:glycosyltransferase involved in cell wall biosynthesis